MLEWRSIQVAKRYTLNTLLVIDMQNAWLADRPALPFDTAGVVDRINHAGACVRALGGSVIFVQHANDEAIAGSRAWQVIDALHKSPGELTVEKRACDPFAATDLAVKLRKDDGGTVFVCGFATEFCVDSALRALTSRALNVVALADAHTTSDRPHASAQTIIAHHNWIWANMALPDSSTLKVMTVAEAFPAVPR